MGLDFKKSPPLEMTGRETKVSGHMVVSVKTGRSRNTGKQKWEFQWILLKPEQAFEMI